jgi:hypothetical protein
MKKTKILKEIIILVFLLTNIAQASDWPDINIEQAKENLRRLQTYQPNFEKPVRLDGKFFNFKFHQVQIDDNYLAELEADPLKFPISVFRQCSIARQYAGEPEAFPLFIKEGFWQAHEALQTLIRITDETMYKEALDRLPVQFVSRVYFPYRSIPKAAEIKDRENRKLFSYKYKFIVLMSKNHISITPFTHQLVAATLIDNLPNYSFTEQENRDIYQRPEILSEKYIYIKEQILQAINKYINKQIGAGSRELSSQQQFDVEIVQVGYLDEMSKRSIAVINGQVQRIKDIMSGIEALLKPQQ